MLKRNRVLLLVITWDAALLGALIVSQGATVLLLPVFPIGLAAIAYRLFPWVNVSLGFFVVVWSIYLVLSVAVVITSTKRSLYVAYGFLVVLLLLNVGGCHLTKPPR